MLRGTVWNVFWYDPFERQVRTLSLRTKDQETAERLFSNFKDFGTVAAPQKDGDWPGWAKKMCRRARENAKAKCRPYDLDPAHIVELFEKQSYRCAVTGMLFDARNTYRNPFAPSLDQIVPGAEYLPANVRIVTVIANTAMNGWGPGPLRQMILNSKLPILQESVLLSNCNVKNKDFSQNA